MTHNRKTVLVDMDGVLVDILPTWMRRYGAGSGEFIHPDMITEYGHETFVTDQALFWESLDETLRQSPPMIGSSYFNQLCEDHDVVVVTYCHPAAENAYAPKQRWLRDWFPGAKFKFVATEHKDLIPGDIIIEDSLKNLEKWEAAHPGGIGMLMEAPYNGGQGVNMTWRNIRTYFEALKDDD